MSDEEKINIPDEVNPEFNAEFIEQLIFQYLNENNRQDVKTEIHNLNEMEFRNDELKNIDDWSEKEFNGVFLIADIDNIVYFRGNDDKYYSEAILRELKHFIESTYQNLNVYTETDWSSITIDVSGGIEFVMFG